MKSETQSLSRILFPTDFSSASREAFRHAERLALATGATLVILHVFELPDTWGTGGDLTRIDDEIKRKLQEIQPSDPKLSVEHVAHGGPPGQVICWVAQDWDCDQIIMGTHGHTGLMHLLLGSVTEYVVRHARCPVLTVRQRPADEAPLSEPEVYQPMPPLM